MCKMHVNQLKTQFRDDDFGVMWNIDIWRHQTQSIRCGDNVEGTQRCLRNANNFNDSNKYYILNVNTDSALWLCVAIAHIIIIWC